MSLCYKVVYSQINGQCVTCAGQQGPGCQVEAMLSAGGGAPPRGGAAGGGGAVLFQTLRAEEHRHTYTHTRDMEL